MPHQPSPPVSGEISELPRRNFFGRALAVLVGGVISVLPVIPAVMYFIDPLTRKRRAVGMTGEMIDAEGYIKITSQDAVGDLPRQFKVTTDLRDFWNKFPSTEVGSVYLRKLPDGNVACFNARCPHLGCTVKFDDSSKTYECPCHASAFSLEGARTNEIPPRNMDTLACKVDEHGNVLVKFEKFRAGIHEKVVV